MLAVTGNIVNGSQFASLRSALGDMGVEGLTGKRILIAEDESLVAMMLQESLEEIGVIVVGPAYSQMQALSAARESKVDGAILDVNLGDGLSFPVAQELRERGIPYCFGTGYGTAGIADEFGDAMVLQKPYRFDDLVECLAALLGKTGNPRATSNSPSRDVG